MLVSVSPGVYEQFAETEFLTVLGAEHVFVASKPGESTMRAYQKAKQIVSTGQTGRFSAFHVIFLHKEAQP